MNIDIGGNSLNYKINGDKYITTYISDCPELDEFIDKIFKIIFPFYTSSNKLQYSNVCGANAEFLCKTLKIDNIKNGKIIITDWMNRNEEYLKVIESVYGPIGMTIRASYHALVYLEVSIKEATYYIAIETTICRPYKLQFYVANNLEEEEFNTIITTRYQCTNFKRSFECDKSWIDIAYDYPKGGKKTNKKPKSFKSRKNKTKSRGRKQSCRISRNKTSKRVNGKKNMCSYKKKNKK
jgi:hypothetical protein